MAEELTCRYCGKPVESAELAWTCAYWKVPGIANQPKYACHAICKREGERREAYECQTIDRSCNDCAHFRREQCIQRPERPSDEALHSHAVQVEYLRKLLPSGGWEGRCVRFDRPVTAHANFAMLMPCFEHRRAGEYDKP